jgi:hypothetical protein
LRLSSPLSHRITFRFWSDVIDRPGRAFWLSLSTLLAVRFAFAVCSLQYHLDGDNTVALIQANDWLSTPQKTYFWGQTYMGTTEVWLFSSMWRLLFGAHSTVPILYWVFCGQFLFSLGAALVQAALVHTDASLWGRPRVFLLSLVVFGFTAPVFQKYTFGLGHGYSAVPFYAGLTIACYLLRTRLSLALLLLAGLLLGQSHYVFRLHLVYPVSLVLALLWDGPRTNAWKVAAISVGVAMGMLPEKMFLPAQGYAAQFCVTDVKHAWDNGWSAITQAAVHVGTLPYSLLESEHALWFAGHRPESGVWIWWGERVGAGLLLILLSIDVVRSLRSSQYLIFTTILAVNIAVLITSCLVLDTFTARRYMYLSVFSFPFLMMHPPWTIWHRLSLLLRTTALAVYAVSAVSFTTPLASFAERSSAQQFDERYDCLVGGGGDLSALMALNDLRVRTVDLNWRLPSNYSRNVAATPEAVRDSCRQLFWVDSGGRPKDFIRFLCEPDEAFYSSSPRGIVSYPQRVAFYRCRVPRHTTLQRSP